MGKNWTFEDALLLESDIKNSIMAATAYFGIDPSYDDVEEDFNEFRDPFFKEF